MADRFDGDVKIYNKSNIQVNPATEEKQDDTISELETLNTVDFATEEKQDTIIANQTNRTQISQIQASDSFSIDAFGRWRVSNPTTLFDSKQIFDDSDLASDVENEPLFYDNQEISGSGTSTAYNNDTASTTLSVSDSTAGTRIRQTKMRFNYQPGKSTEVLMTFTFNAQQSGITQREGQYDDKNGLLFEDNGSEYRFVRRAYTSGSAVDNAVSQSNWNIDPMDGTGASGITLDFTKTQILYMDYEWLGVGRVRMGFVVDGKIYYAHEMNNTNNLEVVYMSTPNLPLRSEISNDGTGGSASMTQICSTVISEGGQNELGVIRSASTDGTHVDCATENTLYAILGMRLKTNYIGMSIKVLNTALQEQQGSKKIEWVLLLNPTVAGTFTYADESRSAIQIARGATANTVTGGFRLAGGYLESGGNQSGNAGSTGKGIENALQLGSLIDGTRDEIVLCVRPIGGTSGADVEGALTWQELS